MPGFYNLYIRPRNNYIEGSAIIIVVAAIIAVVSPF